MPGDPPRGNRRFRIELERQIQLIESSDINFYKFIDLREFAS